jgi:hypothetical protein
VRGVHIGQHQPLPVFGQDVDAVQLGERIAQRRNLAVRRQAFAFSRRGRGSQDRRIGRQLVADRQRHGRLGPVAGRRPVTAGKPGPRSTQCRIEFLARQPRPGPNCAGPGAGQGLVQRGIEEVVDHARLAKADLLFLRVHVDVHGHWR